MPLCQQHGSAVAGHPLADDRGRRDYCYRRNRHHPAPEGAGKSRWAARNCSVLTLGLWPRGSSSPSPLPLSEIPSSHSLSLCLLPSAPVPPPACPPPRAGSQSADFSPVSLSCHRDPSSFPDINPLVYVFVLSGLVGLALSYALSVTNLLSGLISSFTMTETMMVSVERTEEYTTDIPVEPQDKVVQVKA